MTRWDRKTALVTGLGAALAAGAGYAATRFFRRRDQAERHAPALKHGVPPGPLGDRGNIRSAGTEAMRSEERRGGKECGSKCRSRGSPYPSQKNTKTKQKT